MCELGPLEVFPFVDITAIYIILHYKLFSVYTGTYHFIFSGQFTNLVSTTFLTFSLLFLPLVSYIGTLCTWYLKETL